MKIKYKNKINKNAFTFIELVISISILAMLSILWFISYSKNLEDSRDTQRSSDIAGITSSLKLHRTQRWNYPTPWDYFNIVNDWMLVAIQWRLNDSVVISTIDKIPLDPFIKVPYFYSVWRNNQEFQIAATLENNWILKTLLWGDYKSASKNILPTIMLAVTWPADIEINEAVWSWAVNRDKFIFNNSRHNLPYLFDEPFLPYSDDTSFDWLINDPNTLWEQNVEFKNCNDIIIWDKWMWTWEYQINNYWTLENITCFSSEIPKSCREIKEKTPSSTSWQYTIMPEGVSRAFTWYCDMSTASWWWTLVAKSWTDFNYTIGHCNFMDPPQNTSETNSFTYWACDLDQRDLLFWTDSWWVVWTNKVKEDCSTRTTKNNTNTCSWTWASQTFQITQSWWCLSWSIHPPTSWYLWWKWWDWEPTVTKNLAWLTTPLNWACYGVPEYTSYCSLFDIYDDVTWEWIWQWWGYRNNSCWTFVDWALSPEKHLIFVR